MTHIYFIRHAEPNFENHDDRSRELTAKGIADCDLVTQYLLGKSVDAVLSSPYERAVATVRDFADTVHLPINIIEEFRERKVADGWIQDINVYSKHQWFDFNYTLCDGESLGQVQFRNIRALQDVLKQYQDKTVAIGSHGTALSTIVNYYQPVFHYPDFLRIAELMPWIVHFVFSHESCIAIEEYNVFTGKTSKIM